MAQVYKRGEHWWGTFGSQRRSLKIPKGSTKAQARRRWLELATEQSAPTQQPNAAPVAFSGLAGLWLDIQEERHRAGHIRRSTLDRYERIVKTYLIPHWGDRDVREITPLDVERFQAQLGAQIAATTTSAAMGKLRSIFAAGVRGRYIDRSPAEGVQAVKLKHESWDWYDASETTRFLEACAKVLPRWVNWYTVAFRTGLRGGEMAGLNWADVDFQRATITVRRTWCNKYGLRATKGDKVRTVPLAASAVDALKDQRYKTGLKGAQVFSSVRGGREQSGVTQRAIARISLAAGLRQIRSHDTRHSFASQLVSAGVPIVQVAKLLGHASVTTTFRTYAHLAPTTLAGAVSALEGGVAETKEETGTWKS